MLHFVSVCDNYNHLHMREMSDAHQLWSYWLKRTNRRIVWVYICKLVNTLTTLRLNIEVIELPFLFFWTQNLTILPTRISKWWISSDLDNGWTRFSLEKWGRIGSGYSNSSKYWKSTLFVWATSKELRLVLHASSCIFIHFWFSRWLFNKRTVRDPTRNSFWTKRTDFLKFIYLMESLDQL
jgi:hypothetical protein